MTPGRQAVLQAPILDPEFQGLVPSLSENERLELEASLLAEGCRDALVVWEEQNVLLDGHNRLDICERHGLAYRTVSVSLPGRDAAKEWIIRNQFARRNLTPFQRAELALKLGAVVAAKAKERQRGSGGAVVQKSGEPPVRTDKELAKVAGVSHDTIHKARLVCREADEKTKEKLRHGEKTINSVYRELKKRERIEGIRRSAEAEEAGRAPGALRDLAEGAGGYRTVYIDPPWEYEDQGCEGAAARHYPTLPIEDLEHLPVAGLAHSDGSHLWLWTTWPMLREDAPQRLLRAWGFRWVGEVVWDKARIGPGRWLRSQSEVLVLAVKGRLPLLRADQGNVLRVMRTGRHSEKPEEFRKLVESLSPGPRIELFARAAADGWDRWGLEAPISGSTPSGIPEGDEETFD